MYSVSLWIPKIILCVYVVYVYVIDTLSCRGQGEKKGGFSKYNAGNIKERLDNIETIKKTNSEYGGTLGQRNVYGCKK